MDTSCRGQVADRICVFTFRISRSVSHHGLQKLVVAMHRLTVAVQFSFLDALHRVLSGLSVQGWCKHEGIGPSRLEVFGYEPEMSTRHPPGIEHCGSIGYNPVA